MDALSNLKLRLAQAKTGFSTLVKNALKSQPAQNLGAWRNVLENNQLPDVVQAALGKNPLPQDNLDRLKNAGIGVASTIVGGGMQGGYNIASGVNPGERKPVNVGKVKTGAGQTVKAGLTLQGTRAPLAIAGRAGFGGALTAGGDILKGKGVGESLAAGARSGLENLPKATAEAGAWAAISPVTFKLLAPIVTKLMPKQLESLATYLNLAHHATNPEIQQKFFEKAAQTAVQGIKKATLEGAVSMGIYGGIQPAKNLKDRVKNILEFSVSGAVVGGAMSAVGSAFTGVTKGPIGWKVGETLSGKESGFIDLRADVGGPKTPKQPAPTTSDDPEVQKVMDAWNAYKKAIPDFDSLSEETKKSIAEDFYLSGNKDKAGFIDFSAKIGLRSKDIGIGDGKTMSADNLAKAYKDLAANTPQEVLTKLDKALYESDYAKAREILDAIPESAPYKKQMKDIFEPYLPKGEGIPGGEPRGFVTTVKESPTTTPGAKAATEAIVPQTYQQLPNTESFSVAQKRLEQTGPEATRKFVLSDTPWNAEKAGAGQLLMKDYSQNMKDPETFAKFQELVNSMDNQARAAGQGNQILSNWSKMTPEGMINYAQKEIEKANANKSTLDKAVGKLTNKKDVKLAPEDTAFITDMMNKANSAGTEEEKSAYVKRALERIGSKIPWGVSDVIDTYRYNNMLSNPLTHLRNAVNNLMQTFITRPVTLLAEGRPKEALKYEVGALKSIPDGLDAFKVSLKEGKPLGKLDSEMVSKLKPIRKAPLGKYNLPSELMEASDQFFQKIIGGGELARGATPEKATAMAQYSLFRQDLSPEGQGAVLNKIDEVTKAIYGLRKVGLGWFIPFIRTPMNVAKQWIEYSPAGFTTIPGSEDKRAQTAKALLGSTVTLIGAELALQNRVTWSVPTDPKAKQLFYDSGKKPYSVRIGDKWVPLQSFGVFAWALGIPAAVKHYSENSQTAMTTDTLTKLIEVPTSLLGFWSNQTFVSGLGSFVELAKGSTDYTMPKNIGYTLGQLKPMEGLMRYVSTTIDPIYRKAGNLKEQLMSDIPVLSKELPAYRDVTGEPSTRNISNYIAPYSMGQVPSGPKGQNLELAYQARMKKLQTNAINNEAKKKLDALTARLKDGSITQAEWNKQKQKIEKERIEKMKKINP